MSDNKNFYISLFRKDVWHTAAGLCVVVN